MRKLSVSLLVLFISLNVKSQNVIAVQHGSTTNLYSLLDTAVTYAQNGDTIYLPGGGFTLSVPINKRIHIVGTGHHPDSTTATSRTIISGSLRLNTGADNGSITGVYFTGSGLFYNIGQINFESSINGYTISRCYIYGGISNTTGNPQNVVIKENVIGTYSLCFTCDNYFSINLSSPNQLVANNILLSKVQINNSQVKNNIFTWNITFTYPLYASNCVVENNFFESFSNTCTNCIFHNNVNGGTNGTDGNGNQGSGNIYTTQLSNIFISYSPGWDYADNFHLPVGSQYINAGYDGTDIGIYGGLSPWKEGSIPFNPHISFKNIDTQSDANGNLRVRIKIKAQSN